MIYTFDNTLDGLLTAVFNVFERKDKEVRLIQKNLFEVNLFEEVIDNITESEKAKRLEKNGRNNSKTMAQKDILRMAFRGCRCTSGNI
ncbi:MAG: hypothetical protein IPN55_15235 [Saprospiraceae bacterium]|nr:hypothetical protein [Candidatus Brachybacter algidus]